MDLLITDALIVTCDDHRRLIDQGAVAILGSQILAVGDTETLKRAYPDLPRLSGRGLAVCPGFINSHSHTVMSVLRGTIEDWIGNGVYQYMVPIAYEMDDEERAALARLGCLEAIRSGTTSLLELFRFITGYGDAMADSGLRLWFGEHAADIDTRRIRLGDYSVDQSFGAGCIERNEAMIAQFHGARGDRLRCVVAAHATDNCSPHMLRSLMDMSARHGLTRTIHLAQSNDEIRADREMYGKTPAEYLDCCGWLSTDLVGAHWTYCTAADVQLLAERGVQMAHCPANSSTKGPHRTLIGPIRESGVNIAIGTDDKTQDIFHALKFGIVIHRGGFGREVQNGVNPQPQQILDAITRDAARSLGALEEIGSIEPGKKADLTLIDLETPAMRPLINPVSNLVHYGHPGTIHSVIVDGEFVLKDGKVLTMDEKAVLEEAQHVTQRVWERLISRNSDIPPPQPITWYRT